jgi:hypothetical protein
MTADNTTTAVEATDDHAHGEDNDDDDDATCEYCSDRFPTEQLRDLHRGLEHYDVLDDADRAAYEAAYEAETESLRSFRLRALAALVLLYFGFLMLYAVVGL